MAITTTHEVTIEFLDRFADAFNRHHVTALMSFMTEDCVFEASAGPEVCGKQCEGETDRSFDLTIGERLELVCWGVMPSGMLRHPVLRAKS
jgi:ketosteroid isomerase-like protein